MKRDDDKLETSLWGPQVGRQLHWLTVCKRVLDTSAGLAVALVAWAAVVLLAPSTTLHSVGIDSPAELSAVSWLGAAVITAFAVLFAMRRRRQEMEMQR